MEGGQCHDMLHAGYCRNRRLSRVSEASCETMCAMESLNTCRSTCWSDGFSSDSEDFADSPITSQDELQSSFDETSISPPYGFGYDSQDFADSENPAEHKHGKVTQNALASTFAETSIPRIDVQFLAKAFVECAVHGFLVEAFCGTGESRPVVFFLSCEIDAFKIRCAKDGSSRHLDLADVSQICLGDSKWMQNRLDVFQDLSARCAIVEFVDKRCLALRFNGGSWAETGEQEAASFTYFMQAFVSALHG